MEPSVRPDGICYPQERKGIGSHLLRLQTAQSVSHIFIYVYTHAYIVMRVYIPIYVYTCIYNICVEVYFRAPKWV